MHIKILIDAWGAKMHKTASTQYHIKSTTNNAGMDSMNYASPYVYMVFWLDWQLL